MKINVTGKNLDLTDPLRDYVVTKFDRIKRHFDALIVVNVVLEVEKQSNRAEVTVAASGRNLFADATDLDMYAAIDAMVDKLDRQLVKHKEKRQQHGHESLARSLGAE